MEKPAKNILVVDDLPTNRKLLRANLEVEGFTVVDAADGETALQVLAGEEVDCIISDILMPGMDGLRFCMRVKQSERLNTIPFIAFTSTFDSATEEKLIRE